MPKITPFLWFNNQAEEAMNFYVSIFKNSRAIKTTHYGDARTGAAGTVMSVEFELEGQKFIALNGGPHYTLNPAISLFVDCETQEEVDALWEKLAAGSTLRKCGWVTDRFGLTWQIIPRPLGEMLQDRDPVRSRRVMDAMLQMEKINIAELQRAYDGK